MAKDTVRVAIFLRHRVFAESLACALSQQARILAVSCDPSVGSVGSRTEDELPDVAVLDATPTNAVHKATDVLRTAGVKILFMGDSETESEFLAAIEAGAVGYLSYRTSLETAARSVRAVASGEAVCSPKQAGLLIERLSTEMSRRARIVAGQSRLTRREQQIVRLIRDELSNKEIAVRLGIEVQTVKNHVHNILEKLQRKRRHDAARYAFENGLVSERMG